jgi:uncharacterized protein YndB with AHSA1/START domain
MIPEKIKISAIVSAEKPKVWNLYTQPEHITQWNFADPSWHCPKASNDMAVGGHYIARMEARDGSYGFDFEAVYTEIIAHNSFTYEFGGRFATIEFNDSDGKTEVTVNFDPETENPVELQRAGWQAILNNFKTYCETQ